MENSQATIERLLQRIAELEKVVATPRKENRLLREQLVRIQRTHARRAAPFRRRESKKVAEGEKKRPGRKPGYPGTCRAVPEHVDEEIEKPLDCRPKCGGPFATAWPNNGRT